MPEHCAPPLLVLALAGAMSGCSAGPPPPVTFSLTDLGTLSGTESYACAINDGGEVAGYATTKDDVPKTMEPLPPGIRLDVHTVRWTGKTIEDLGAMGGAPGCSQGINHAGQVVGYSLIAASSEIHATLWTGTTPTDLGTVAGDHSSAVGINAKGQVAGNSTIGGTHIEHAALWNGATATDLGTLGGRTSSATGINDSGWVVGYSETKDTVNSKTHAVLWKGGTPTDLGTLPGGDYSFATAINNRGVVVGYSGRGATSSAGTHAAVWADTKVFDLRTLGGEFSAAFGINDAGLVVGNAALKGNSRTHAALWIGTKIYDLNDLVDGSGRGWRLFEARGINASGQIVGYGRSLWGWGPQHGFLLTPINPIPLPPKGGW
jgi:probable HAF family extracellular repeat protein